MPELPEVEVTRRGIAPHIAHQKIKEVRIHFPTLRWPISSEISNLSGQTILEVKRRAKYLLLQTESGTVMVHLGMSGCMQVLDQSVPLGKHDHVELLFENGTCLRYNDPRRFGAWLWSEQTPIVSHPLLNHLAPEPLSDAFDGAYLFDALQRKRRPIKVCLMDQTLVVGVGNIYANEVLFQMGIHPETYAYRLSQVSCAQLVVQIKATLKAAIVQGGTTLKDFSQADGKPGYFKQQLNVYGRQNKPCRTCGTSIEHVKLGQRATYFCPQCQIKKDLGRAEVSSSR